MDGAAPSVLEGLFGLLVLVLCGFGCGVGSGCGVWCVVLCVLSLLCRGVFLGLWGRIVGETWGIVEKLGEAFKIMPLHWKLITFRENSFISVWKSLVFIKIR